MPDDLEPRTDVPDLQLLAEQLIADLLVDDSGLDAVGTFSSWEHRLTTDDYQTLAISLARRIVATAGQ